MINSSSTAKQVSELMLGIYNQLEGSLEMVKSSASSEEYAAYQRSVGKVVCRVIFDVLEPLYAQHPALKPTNWDERAPL
jgi:hypothetical protein